MIGLSVLEQDVYPTSNPNYPVFAVYALPHEVGDCPLYSAQLEKDPIETFNRWIATNEAYGTIAMIEPNEIHYSDSLGLLTQGDLYEIKIYDSGIPVNS